MARKYPEGNYVYIHIKNDNGQVFYVGRGKEYRAWAKTGRNKHWNNISLKHGYTVEVVESGLTRDEANHLEILVIELALACGCVLANKTSGGDGVTDLVFTDESKIKMSRSQGGRRVHCSNGMTFETCQEASDWLNKNGQPLALSGHISACARGDRTAAYGHTWWYDGDEPKDYVPRYERLSITSSTEVFCSNGMSFRNATKAADWLRQQGFKGACRSGIEGAIFGRFLFAYGYAWWRSDQAPVNIETQKFRKMMISGRRIIMDESLCFFNMDFALQFIRESGHDRASKSSLTVCAQGKTKTAYGHTWKYADEQD